MSNLSASPILSFDSARGGNAKRGSLEWKARCIGMTPSAYLVAQVSREALALAQAAVRFERNREDEHASKNLSLRANVYEHASCNLIAFKAGLPEGNWYTCDKCGGSGDIVDNTEHEQLACEVCDGHGIQDFEL